MRALKRSLQKVYFHRMTATIHRDEIVRGSAPTMTPVPVTPAPEQDVCECWLLYDGECRCGKQAMLNLATMSANAAIARHE